MEPVISHQKAKISVTIPAGIDNGQSVRIREKGEPGTNGGPRGDLLVEVDGAAAIQSSRDRASISIPLHRSHSHRQRWAVMCASRLWTER